MREGLVLTIHQSCGKEEGEIRWSTRTQLTWAGIHISHQIMHATGRVYKMHSVLTLIRMAGGIYDSLNFEQV
jgi:hypothetical protein